MVVNVKDHVNQCYSNADGEIIKELVLKSISHGNHVTLSFRGINGVTSSFVNSAFIELLSFYSIDKIKSSIRIIHSTKQINELILGRFDFEVNKRDQVCCLN